MPNTKTMRKSIFILWAFILIIAPYFFPSIEKMSSGIAVISGIILSLIIGNPLPAFTKKTASFLLTWSVVGLGFGMNLITVAKVGLNGIGYTIFSIIFTLCLGLVFGRLFKNKRDISVLISVGTAICGGSAIAAIAPSIKAKHHDISIALAVIFILNAVALFIFPFLGHYFNLSQQQFGIWSALAIHDTSSVVGTTMQYGPQALNIGTTIKLTRALWIVPLTFVVSYFYQKKIFHKENENNSIKAKKPWFILGFLIASALVTWVPAVHTSGLFIREIAEKALVLTLFCIGSNISKSALKEVGIRPFLQGVSLWIVTLIVILVFIIYHIIS